MPAVIDLVSYPACEGSRVITLNDQIGKKENLWGDGMATGSGGIAMRWG